MSWQDPIVAEVRETREALAAAHGFDLRAIFADLRARQMGNGDRLVRVQSRDAPNQHSQPDATRAPAASR